MDDDERAYMKNIINLLVHIAKTLEDLSVALNPSQVQHPMPPEFIDKNRRCSSCGNPANQTTNEHEDMCDVCFKASCPVGDDISPVTQTCECTQCGKVITAGELRGKNGLCEICYWSKLTHAE